MNLEKWQRKKHNMKPIPYGRQDINLSDIYSVVNVLKSDWLTQGPKIEEFEKVLASYCGAKYAVVVSNGTAALHIACLAAGLRKGDEAITTPVTFLATSNSVLYAGAKPIFADIDIDTINIDVEQVNRKITKRTKAILPVHFAGLPCDMAELYRMAKKKGIMVIEDACHALGAEYKDRGKWVKVGSCKHSDMTVFSFHPVKHITTGEGGAITTNSKKLYEKLLSLRSHGMCKTNRMTKEQGPWYYEMKDLGFNYRITDLQCAIGISQLKRINGFLKRRREIANTYDKAFKDMEGVEAISLPQGKKHSYHLYLLKIDFKKFHTTRKNFMTKLKKKGILTQVHYIPIYRQPYYKDKFGLSKNLFPKSEKYYEKAISIPIYYGMNNKEVKKVTSEIKETLYGRKRKK